MHTDPVLTAHRFYSQNPVLQNTDRSHILLYTEDHGVGGIAQFNHALLCYLSTHYRVTCVQSRSDNPLIQQQQELGIQHIWLDCDTMKDWSRLLYHRADTYQVFKETQPDLILFSDGWPMSSFAAKQVAIAQGIPYIVCLGFMDPNYATFGRADGISYIESVAHYYDQAQAVVAVAEENLTLLNQIFELPPAKGQLIHYGRSQSFFRRSDSVRQQLRDELNIPHDAIICFTAARLTPIKGYLYQLQAIERLMQTEVWNQLYFVWAGPGASTHSNQEPLLRDRVAQLGVGDRVKFLGQRWDIANWMDASDIFVLTSELEGMPLAVMEAMAKGLPIVASDVSGIGEELGDTGQLLPDPKRQPEATVQVLVETLEKWVNQPELRRSVGAACQRRAEAMFTEERMLKQYGELIQQVLQSLKTEKAHQPVKSDIKFNKLLGDQIHYNDLVWSGWLAYKNQDFTEMAKALEQSFFYTPFSGISTIMHWVDSFGIFSREKGEALDAYALTNLLEWQQLIKN
jgi:glycosyltransferase involved in cell wall biosynthesis